MSHTDIPASKRIRTSDLPRIRRRLCQLSYACIFPEGDVPDTIRTCIDRFVADRSLPLAYGNIGIPSLNRRRWARTTDLRNQNPTFFQLNYTPIPSTARLELAIFSLGGCCSLPLSYVNTAPRTGFEPASPHRPTVFKTAPSPPGHTAYKGEEDRTHTYGIKTRCAAITLRPCHDSGWIRTTGTVSRPTP